MKSLPVLLISLLAIAQTNAQNLIQSSGPIGINTITPRTNLEIRGDARLSSTVTGSSFILQGSSMHPDNDYSNVRMIASSANGSGHLKTMLDNYGGTFSWGHNSDLGEVKVMVIDATAGNIGIGTDAPTQRLDVNGAAKFGGGGGGAFSIGSVNGTYRVQTNASGPGIRFLNTGNSYSEVGMGRLSIGASYGGVVAPASGALIEGNVGIGTTDTKGYKLAVNGNAIFTKVKVQAFPWADYVFNDDYHLRPLSEVEQFIREHKHLPEVPTAEEVHKNGIDVGDNQATLLKKIEELTLYLIEQNKRLERQNDQMEALIKRNEAHQNEIDALKKQLKTAGGTNVDN